MEKFYPAMQPADQTGVFRRHLFQAVAWDLRATTVSADLQPASSTGQASHDEAFAANVIQDWLETHGGELRLSGARSNLSDLADAVAWPTRFFSSFGRLLPFLRRHGLTGDSEEVIVGMRGCA